jgi:hypothetical protein
MKGFWKGIFSSVVPRCFLVPIKTIIQFKSKPRDFFLPLSLLCVIGARCIGKECKRQETEDIINNRIAGAFFPMKIDIRNPKKDKSVPLKHCNVETMFERTFQPVEGKQIALYGLSDQSIVPSLFERCKRQSIRVMVFTAKKTMEKHWKEYFAEFGFSSVFHARYLPFEEWKRLKPEQFFSFDCFDVQALIEFPITTLSAIFRLLTEPGIFSLYYEESHQFDQFVYRLLHKAEMGEVIGLLEKVGFQPPFLIQRMILHPKCFLRIRSRKNRIFT